MSNPSSEDVDNPSEVEVLTHKTMPCQSSQTRPPGHLISATYQHFDERDFFNLFLHKKNLAHVEFKYLVSKRECLCISYEHVKIEDKSHFYKYPINFQQHFLLILLPEIRLSLIIRLMPGFQVIT